MTSSRVVAVANGDYLALKKLERAVPDTTELVRLLTEKHEFEAVLLADKHRGVLLDEIDVALAAKSIPAGALVLLWTGHGVLGPDGTLRLLGRTETADREVVKAATLGEFAARTGAAQVLVVVDTCFAGEGVPDALAMANAVLGGRADPMAAWFGVVAAARGDEPARSGALALQLSRLLNEGPTDPVLRDRWNLYGAKLRGDDLIDALLKEWSEPRQSPQQAGTGNAWPMLRNPLYRARPRHAVVEHLLQAARSSSTGLSFFTGREEALEPIVAWLRRNNPGTWVVTGPAGSGKSAIAGRIVSLSEPEERQRLAEEAVPAHLDPGELSVDVHLHVRGLDRKGAAKILAAQLDLDADAGIYDVLAYAGRRREAGDPLVVVIDGLDEAGDVECRDIALQVIEPLGREALVLVGTREIPGGTGEPGLLALLSTTVGTTDLGTAVEDTVRDVRRYAARRLHDVSPIMDPELVADEIANMARSANSALEGPFLLARLITSQLRQSPVDTSGTEWRTQLASSVEAALEEDLRRTILKVGGRAHPTAARELLFALACAYGAGIPADDVWPEVASALSPNGTQYTRDDVYALLLELGRHVVASTIGDQAVYRVAHQRLVDYLRPMVGFGSARHLSPVVAQPVAEAVAKLYSRLLDEGQTPTQHPYLWRYTWRHLAEAGQPGLDLLRPFVDRDRDSFLPDLVEALELVAARSWWLGSADDAVVLREEAVALSEELDDPLDLAMRLFGLAMARATAGDADGAEAAASEAAALARRFDDDPDGRRVLTAGLSAHALSQLRQGDFDAASRLAVEAIGLTETLSDQGNTNPDTLAGLFTIGALAALSRGDVQQADEFSRRALTLLDERTDDPGTDASLLDALQVRAQVELLLISRSTDQPGGADVPTAAARIVELHRTKGATGTILDISLAQGLRIAALTLSIGARRGTAGPSAQNATDVLDDAIALVSPMAGASTDAGLAAAMNLIARVELGDDLERVISDLEEAEQQLRRIQASSRDAKTALGAVISHQVRIATANHTGDPTTLVQRQQDAADLLAGDQRRLARELRCNALVTLAELFSGSARYQEAAVAIEELVDERRDLHDGSEQATIHLAAALAEFAGTTYHARPFEAANAASEGIDLLDAIDDPSPNVSIVRGFCELNLSAAYLPLNRLDEATQSVCRAIGLLDIGSDLPVVAQALTTAFVNQATLLLQAGDNEAALRSAQRAMSLLENPHVATRQSIVVLAQISLGRALSATGQEAAGAELLNTAIAQLKTQAGTDERSMAYLAVGLDAAGPAIWDAVLTELADQVPLAVRLAMLRTRPPEELEQTIADIRAGMAAGEGDPTLMVFARDIARVRRAANTALFDAAWVEPAGEVPDWLLIDPSLSHLVIAWWNQPTWQKSHDYLLANPALLDPATDLLIEELHASGADNELAALHLRLRASAADLGVEAAYAPILADLLLQNWENAEDSEAFLVEHYDELLGEDVAEVLSQDRDEGDPGATMVLAVLVLARRAEQALAFQILDEPADGVSLLGPSWRSADVERLEALAILTRGFDETDPPHWRLATTALAIARALNGNSASAVEFGKSAVAEIPDQAERVPLVSAVVDALAFHPDRRDELIALLQVLQQNGAEPDTPK